MSSNLYLKDPGFITGVDAKQNVTLPLIYDSTDDSSFEPQFIRQRDNNTATFCPNNVAQSLGESAVINVDLSGGQTIFNIVKRIHVSNVVVDVDVIDNIRPGNNVLKFTYSAVEYTITFKNMLIKTATDLRNYLNTSHVGPDPTYTITPAFPTFTLTATVPADYYNSELTSLTFTDTTGPTSLAVTLDTTSSFFTAGKAMWGSFLDPGAPPTRLILNPGYLPAYYWDFKSVLLTKWNKNRNWNSRNTSDNIYRYYFKTRSGVFINYMNWNKESLTNFDLSIVDDQGVTVFNGYTFSGPPFVAIEIVGSQ